ncbi:MAG: hypothetical protein QOJ11_855 [Frankiales bacterium]|nr:hypothetical protein [Frankiales bacterium]
MTEPETPPPAGQPTVNPMADLTADPVVLASGVLVALAMVLLIVGVTGSWHWRAAVWGAVLASVAAFGLVAYAASQRRSEFPSEVESDDGSAVAAPRPATRPAGKKAATTASADTASLAKASAEAEAAPPRPRFAGFGKPKPADAAPAPKPPPPQPTNVQVMHVQGSNVRVAPTPAPMPISRPERPPSRPPSSPPATPPTIQVGLGREPGFPTYQPVDPGAPVIQVRNRYHRPDCRYVAVAAPEDAVQTTVGAARASNAMPCGVCRP